MDVVAAAARSSWIRVRALNLNAPTRCPGRLWRLDHGLCERAGNPSAHDRRRRPLDEPYNSGNVTRLVDLERRAAWRPAKGQIRSGGGPSERQKVPVAVDHHSRPLAARRSP